MWEERDKKTGRYKDSPPCDCCGKPVGTFYGTDAEACGGSDGPGFYLCMRVRCTKKRAGLSAEERRQLYTACRFWRAAMRVS